MNGRSSVRGAGLAIILITAGGVPLLLLPASNDPVDVPKLTLLILGSAAASLLWVFEALRSREGPGPSRILFAPAAAVLLPLFISWIFSPYPGWAAVGHYTRFMGLLPYVFTILFGLLASEYLVGRVNVLVRALVFVAGAISLYGVLQVLGLDPMNWRTQGVASSTLGNPNFTGGFLAISLPLVLGIWVEERRTALAAGGAALIVCGLIVTQSEGAWAAAMAGLLLSIGVYGGRRWRKAPAAGVIAASAVAILLLGVVAATLVVDDVPDRLATADRRGDWWIAAVSMALDHPLAGKGPNSFTLENPRYQPVTYATLPTLTDDPHSVPLAFLASTGLLGAGWLIGIGLAARRFIAAPTNRMFVPALQGAAAAYVVQALVSVDTVALRTAGWTVAGGLAAAVFEVPRGKRPATRRSLDIRSRVFVAVAGLAAATAVWWGVTLLIADIQFRSAQQLFSRGQGTPALQMFDAAVDLRPDVQYRRMFGLRIGDAAIATAEAGATELSDSLFDIAAEQLRFVEDVPHLPTISDYAQLLERRAEFDRSAAADALVLHRRAASIAPRDPDFLLPAARFLIETGESRDVERMLSPVADQLRDPEVWGLLALARAQLNDPAARRAIEEALALDPNQREALTAAELIDG